jgi:hypothetical protein
MSWGVDLKGMSAADDLLSRFSERRANAALATALTRTVLHLREVERAEAVRTLDRPTPYTLRGIQAKTASASDLAAEVRIAGPGEFDVPGTPPVRYLWWQVEGGAGRQLKRFERALQAAGLMPPGWYAVPGAGARLDQYGNISPGQLVQIMSQLRAGTERGSLRHMARGDDRRAVSSRRRAMGRAGGEFVAIPKQQGKLKPGVYLLEGKDFGARLGFGRNGRLRPVLVFVRAVAYARRYDFRNVAASTANDRLPIEIDRALTENLQRLSDRGPR